MRKTLLKTAEARGFTLIELAIVVSVAGILAGLFLNRIGFYQEQAEKAAMEQTLGVIRSALHLQVASLVAKGRESEIPNLLIKNPMDWLADKPKNYAGEYFAPKPQDIEPGSWYFDLQSGNLIYLPRNNAHLRLEQGEPSRLRFRVQLVTGVRGEDRESAKPIEGVTVNPVVSYMWF